MKEHPLLYSAPMVLAKLAGRKTQTRRIIAAPNSFVDGYSSRAVDFGSAWVDPGPSPMGNPGPYLKAPSLDGDGETTHRVYPRYQAGDRIWGRETFAVLRIDGHERVAYRATCERDAFDYANPLGGVQRIEVHKWTPSIFMPRRAARILDEITAVRPERLQEITETDAIAEGLERFDSPLGDGSAMWGWPGGEPCYRDPRAAYFGGWDWLNGKGAAARNPWVWVITTKALKP